MSLKEVINTNLALNPLLTRGEKAQSVIPYEITLSGNTGVTDVQQLTDGEATFAAFQFTMPAGSVGDTTTEYYNIAFPTTNDLAYNPRLYPVLNVIAGDTNPSNLTGTTGYGAVTARILYRGNYVDNNGGNQIGQPAVNTGAIIQITRAIGKGETGKNPAIVEVRLVEMPINDVGLNADGLGTMGNQIRDTVIQAA